MKLAVISRGNASERKKEMLTGASHLSAGGREGEKIPLRARASWVAGRFPAWAESFRPVRFIIFFLDSLSFFCFPDYSITI
jgi:hypothetical protein